MPSSGMSALASLQLIPLDEQCPHPTFTIARLSSWHGFAHSHGDARSPTTHMMQNRQKMTLIISISSKPLQPFQHKFVNVMA
jgi:hypothetical protein